MLFRQRPERHAVHEAVERHLLIVLWQLFNRQPQMI